MLQAGAYVKEEVCRALIVLISNAPELHGYAARCMYQALKSSLDQADIPLSLVTCTSWFLGNFLLQPEGMAARKDLFPHIPVSMHSTLHLVLTKACKAHKSSVGHKFLVTIFFW